MRAIVGDALMLVAAGTALGLPVGLVAGSGLRAFLYGVTPYHLPTLAFACLVLVMTTIAAALVPARRAAAVDPMRALRCE